MRIEKITENKIRIILNLEDLKENNIDLHAFMSNSLESQDLFLDMLEKAEEEVGFKTTNYKLMIEAIATSDGNFILTITRLLPEKSPTTSKTTKKNIKAKRKLATPDKLLSIYKFNTFDDFCEFCTYLDSTVLKNKLKSSMLYLYNSEYYLILNNIRINLKDFKTFCYAVTEFGSYVKNCTLFERKLKEYGKIIIKQNAIGTCVKYF